MICELIAVGTEILLGDILNTDAQYLSQELSSLGINVYYQGVVGDNHDRLLAYAKTAIARSDMVIFSGGLGPTSDDITKETVAEALGLESEMHTESLENLLRYFKGRPMPESNKKQALIPKGAMPLKNLNGTAPGFLYDNGEKIVVVLPGPPKELTVMFENFVKPYLQSKSSCVFRSKFYHIFGIGESLAANMVKDIIDGQTNPTIAPYAKDTEAVLRVTAQAESVAEAERKIDETGKKLYAVFGNDLYGENEDTLESVTVRLLIRHGLKIATAESCTAGLIAAKIGSVAGASAVLEQSFVTYANAAKQALVGVKAETLAAHGAVSAETAMEMAEGARLAANADIGVSATGIAGPDGGTPEKPVGLVYIGLATRNKTESFKLQLRYDRNKNRMLTACHALNFVRKEILKQYKEKGE